MTYCLPLLATWAALNLVAAGLMAWDKMRAGTPGAGRISEKMFYRIAMVGGLVGIVAASWALRHKTRKRVFMGTVWFLGLVGSALWLAVAFALDCL